MRPVSLKTSAALERGVYAASGNDLSAAFLCVRTRQSVRTLKRRKRRAPMLRSRYAQGLTGVVLCLLVLLCAALPARAVNTVEQWGIYEVGLKGPTNGNPFLEVDFSVIFQMDYTGSQPIKI